jgi:tetratricopeptide (TPR) repeat protein
VLLWRHYFLVKAVPAPGAFERIRPLAGRRSVRPSLKFGRFAWRGSAWGMPLILVLLLTATHSTAQTKNLNDLVNLALCNGQGHASPQAQITGCTALITSADLTTLGLAVAYNNRGNAYTKSGDYDRAIRDFNDSIRYNPRYAKPFNNRGVAYQKKGKYDEAIKNFDEAIRISPKYAIALANRADVYQRLNQYDRSGHDYDEAVQLDPSLEEGWIGSCWVRTVLGQLQQALAACRMALQLKPRTAKMTVGIYDSRGLAYLKMGQFDAAIDDYNSALHLEPKLASSLYGRGLAKLKKGDSSNGNADIAAAKSVDPKISDDFVRYGVR